MSKDLNRNLSLAIARLIDVGSLRCLSRQSWSHSRLWRGGDRFMRHSQRELYLGTFRPVDERGMVRDSTLFKDDDGNAYPVQGRTNQVSSSAGDMTQPAWRTAHSFFTGHFPDAIHAPITLLGGVEVGILASARIDNETK